MRLRTDLLCLAWLLGWCTVTYANTSLAQDFAAYDFVSLGLGALAGMFGGVARTLIALMSTRQLVADAKILLAKDLGVSLVCGAIGYVVIQGWNSFAAGPTFGVELPTITKDLRILLLLVCGYAPRWAFSKVHTLAEAAASRAHKSIRGTDDPISEVAPLGEK